MEFSTYYKELNSESIKPHEALRQYAELLQSELPKYLPKYLATGQTAVAKCPACQSQNARTAFEKFALTYSRCSDCQTLFANQHPTADQLHRFFQDSQARQFWFTQIWPVTAEARREKILAPMADWIATFVAEQLAGRGQVRMAEYFASHWGLWETLRKVSSNWQVQLCEPMFRAEQMPEARAAVVTPEAATLDAAILNDALGRVPDVGQALRQVWESLRWGGLCFATTVLSTGFDIQVLGGDSEAVLPPDRLTLLSYEGLRDLVGKCGFELLEFSTPGQLDFQNVALAATQGKSLPPFVHYMVT